MTCKNCIHWSKYKYNDFEEIHECSALGDFCCSIDFNKKGIDHFKLEAGVIGGGTFVSKATFNCSLWKQK